MRLMRTLTAVAVSAALLGGCTMSAQTESQAPAANVAAQQLPELKIPYEVFTLDNGLTVVVHEDRKAPIVAVNVWYGVGSKDEKPGKTGFAHLFEHLMFNGSENYDDEYFGPFEKAGATDMNGTTNNDRTNYFQNVPTPALDMALWMESDRMGHLLGAVTQAKLDEQRGVVQNEKRQGESQPYGRVWGVLAENSFPKGHPYSWSVIGSMDDLNAASLDDVHQWFKDYYGAANAVLVLAGDIDAKTARAKAEQYFGDIPAGKPLKKLDAWVAKRTGTKRLTMEDHVPAARIYKAWNTAQMGTADSEYMNLLSDVLTMGKSSRLYKRLVQDEQVASSVASFNYERKLAGQLIIIADAKAGVSLDTLDRIIDEELAKLMAEGPTQDELDRIRFSTAANFVRGAERIGGFGGKSDILASGMVYHGDPGYFDKQMDIFAKATPADIKAAMNRWLDDGQLIMEVTPQPKYQVAEAGADRSKLPTVGKLPTLDLPELTSFTLSNGLEVAVAERHDTPNVEMQLVFDAGYAADQGAKPGTASFAMAMLAEGTKNMTSVELSEAMQKLGTNWGSNASLDNATLSLDSLTANLDQSLALFSDVLQNPAFDQEEMDKLRSRWLEGIRKEKARPMSMALRVLPPLLFGEEHGYGVPLTGSGTEASVNALTRDDLVNFHQTWLRPDNARLVIVGDTKVETIKPLLEQHLANWQAPATPKPVKKLAKVAPPKKAKVYLINQPGTPQSTIIAGQLAPSGTSEQAELINVMNTILGGTFTSRLNMNLREDKHWSYGARSMWLDAKAQGLYLAYAPVQTDKTKESIQEILKEFRGYIGKKPATAEELAKVKANKTAKLPGAYETKGSLLGSLVETLDKGKDVQWLESYGQRVNNIALDQVRINAKEVLTPEAFTWVIVGDLEQIEDKVRSLKLGEVIKLDENGNRI
ncbi:pitrilysin family protein [Gallaecimonas sp. GXIMD4217]|uniref:M16 family metallopeptidase n=1 Tax=Gallaecimonas sp. GXIMD4217 TaxID=3131927 RepID=UPI00311AD80D